MTITTTSKSDLACLLDLNRDYITSVQTSDVLRFDEILADDFHCSTPEGSLVDRAAFLEQTALPVRISNLEPHDVKVRIMGDFAIIHARTTHTGPDGRPGSGRYTDVWARRQGPVARGVGARDALLSPVDLSYASRHGHSSLIMDRCARTSTSVL